MRVQRVLMPDGSESWTVLGPTGEPVPAVEAFLAHLQALDRSPTTVRTYATSLKLWLQFLDRLGVAVDEATVDHVSRFVAWLRCPGRQRHGAGRRFGPVRPGHGEQASGRVVLLLRLPGPQRGGAGAVVGGVAAGQPGRLPAVPAARHRRPAGGRPGRCGCGSPAGCRGP